MLFALLTFAQISFSAPDWAKAEKNIKYVKPSEVKQFPPAVRKALEQEKCMIPTVPGFQGNSGWTKGKFADKRQTDWAVLCSSDGRSKIKVIWGGRDFACPDVLELKRNRAFLQAQGKDKATFSRYVEAVPAKKIIEFLARDKKPVPKSFEEDGIVDGFAGKGSRVFYCSNGRWLSTRAAK